MSTQVRTSAAHTRDALDSRLDAEFGPSTPETEALIAASILAHRTVLDADSLRLVMGRAVISR